MAGKYARRGFRQGVCKLSLKHIPWECMLIRFVRIYRGFYGQSVMLNLGDDIRNRFKDVSTTLDMTSKNTLYKTSANTFYMASKNTLYMASKNTLYMASVK